MGVLIYNNVKSDWISGSLSATIYEPTIFLLICRVAYVHYVHYIQYFILLYRTVGTPTSVRENVHQTPLYRYCWAIAQLLRSVLKNSTSSIDANTQLRVFLSENGCISPHPGLPTDFFDILFNAWYANDCSLCGARLPLLSSCSLVIVAIP